MNKKPTTQNDKPMVSIIIPAYNEEAIVKNNLEVFYEYMVSLDNQYNWEFLFINDGSKDNTGILADQFAKTHPGIKVIHHMVNLNLGNALKTGFANAKSDYTVVMDLDLSYKPEHIGMILNTLISTQAHVVIASPYMKGGRVTAVPFLRKIMSKYVNRFMRISAQEKFHTYTGMVRGYRTDFIKNLNLKTKDYEINPEILYKSMILRARIVEIPAHLNWTEQNKVNTSRVSSMRIMKSIFSGLMSGFIFRPYIFFLGVGTVLFLLATYIIVWIFINTFNIYPDIAPSSDYFDARFSEAVAIVFQRRPHSFFVGGFTLVVSLIFIAMGFLSLQSKRYFEELFHINSNILQKNRS